MLFLAINDIPTVSSIADQNIDEDGTSNVLAFTVGDVETLAGDLTVTATSSDETLVPNGNIVLGGVGRGVLLGGGRDNWIGGNIFVDLPIPLFTIFQLLAKRILSS